MNDVEKILSEKEVKFFIGANGYEQGVGPMLHIKRKKRGWIYHKKQMTQEIVGMTFNRNGELVFQVSNEKEKYPNNVKYIIKKDDKCANYLKNIFTGEIKI